MSALDTNESRKLWRKRVRYCTVVYGDTKTGWFYTCPRCGWESERGMRWQEGALRLGMEHDAHFCAGSP